MKQIAILGTAPTLALAPVNSDDWEIWACSPGTIGTRRIDKFFELHRWQPGIEWFPEAYVNFLKNFKGEVMMSAPTPDVKNCTVLPVHDLVTKYGPYFFTSSIAWMVAMAIEAGAEKIGLWGVDMAATTEYKEQRMGCQYMCMIAKSLGIEVGVPPESDLLRPAPLYGVCEQSHGWISQTQRNQQLVMRAEECKAQLQKSQDELNFLNGSLDDQDWVIQSFFGGMETLGTKYTEPQDASILNGVPLAGVNTELPPGVEKELLFAFDKKGRDEIRTGGLEDKKLNTSMADGVPMEVAKIEGMARD